MKYIYILISVTLITVLTFCTSEKEVVNEVSQNRYISKRLTESAIFIKDSIEYARLVSSNLQIDESRKYFLKAVDLLVNKKNPKESVSLFREAIMYYPDERFYFYLTKAYIELTDTTNATLANRSCRELNYEPYYDVAFNDALISAIKKDTINCISNLSKAINNGFLNKKKIFDEKIFDFIREDERYINTLAWLFTDDTKLRAMLFKNYLKSMPDLSLPYLESIDSVATHSSDKYINYDYALFVPEMEEGSFSRDVSNEYMYVGKIKLENNYHAVVYKTYSMIADTLNPVKTYLATYDSLGVMVDNEVIGCFCSPTTSQAFTIKKDMTIESNEYTYKWKYDPIEKGYAGNKIESFEVDKDKQIQLGDNGMIKRISIAGSTTIKSPKEGG